MSEMTWPTRGRHGSGRIGRQVRNREHVGIAAVPVGQPQRVDHRAVGVPAQRRLRRRRIRCPARDSRNCAAGIRLPCGVAERVTPRHLDLGERAVAEPVAQFALGADVAACRSASLTVCVMTARPCCRATRVPTTAPDGERDDEQADDHPRQDAGAADQVLQIGQDQDQRTEQPDQAERRARCAPATASGRAGRGRSTPARPRWWRSAGRRSRPWWRRRTRCRTARPGRA